MREEPTVWADIFLVLVVSRFLSDLVISNLLSPGWFVVFALALIAIIALRGPFSFAHQLIRTGLSIIGIIIFFGDCYIRSGVGVGLAFTLLFGLLLLIYFFIRGGKRLFGSK